MKSKLFQKENEHISSRLWQHVNPTMINSQALSVDKFLLIRITWALLRHAFPNVESKAVRTRERTRQGKEKIMKQIATIFSKQLLTAPTNHWTNCIWIKGSPFENNIKIPNKTPSRMFAWINILLCFHLSLSLSSSEAPPPHKKWVFHYHNFYCMKYLHFNQSKQREVNGKEMSIEERIKKIFHRIE